MKNLLIFEVSNKKLNKMKTTKTITSAQAANLEILIAEYLRVKGSENTHSVYFRKTRNWNSYADTLSLCYTTQGHGTSYTREDEVANGQVTNSVLRKCPLRVFEYKTVRIEWGSDRVREELHIDFAALLLDPKGAEILANATKLAQASLSK